MALHEPIRLEDLSPRILQPKNDSPGLEATEKALILEHLRLAHGNRTRAARSLGISREGLRKKMKRLKISGV
jgi:transcriptional regulator of acetoin/glycerol metabolism